MQRGREGFQIGTLNNFILLKSEIIEQTHNVEHMGSKTNLAGISNSMSVRRSEGAGGPRGGGEGPVLDGWSGAPG